MAIDNVVVSGSPAISDAITAEGQPFEWRNLYPNPARGFVQLELWSPTAATVQLSLSDVAGRTAALGSQVLQAGTNQLRVALPTGSKGMYLLRLSYMGRQYSKPVTVLD
jgi:hypothetical protein